MDQGSRRQGDPRELVTVYTSLPPCSGLVHPLRKKSSRRGRRPAWMRKELLAELRG